MNYEIFGDTVWVAGASIPASVILKIAEELKPKRFKPPSKPEVAQYLHTEKAIDDFTAQGIASTFVDFYDSKGWKVGKNPMVNWKSALNKFIPQQQVKKW